MLRRFVPSRLQFLEGPRLGSLGLSLLALGIALTASIIAATGAVFTDMDNMGGNGFTIGTVDLATSPASAVVSVGNMAPGDSSVGGLTVSNNGSLQLRYAITSVTTEDTLATKLDMTIWDEGVETDIDTTCNSVAPGSVLYGPGDLGSTSGISLVGDPAQGSQAGDRVLNAGTSELLCVLVGLPLDTDNSYQGLSSVATFDLASEQTANNS